MIFSDRPTVRSNRTPPRDESQTGLISEMAEPGTETTSETASKMDAHRSRLQWQESLPKQVPYGDNYTHKVHVWDETMSETTNKDPVKHFMRYQSNTPVLTTSSGAQEDDRVYLNVGGVRHETHVSTLKNVPGSRLSRLADVHRISNRGKHEYFFDRHPAVFSSIIDFYRTGELHVPLEVCGAVVKRELDFWQIEELQIKACCWRHYRSYIENERILNSFDRSLEREQMKIDLSNLKGWKLLQMKIWLIMDRPRTSRNAMMYGVTSFLFVTASIAGFCLETLPELRPKMPRNNSEEGCNGDSSNHPGVFTSNKALGVLDFICTIFFTLELVMRFVVSPRKLKFIRNPMNIMDLLALVPLYVQVIFEHSDLQSCYMNERFVIEIMFILRIFRMFRIFHLVKHYQALKVLVYALRASLKELMMLFIFLLIATLIFATVIYYAERTASDEKGTSFTTIPIGFWWAITTMTTVGYGDITPRTPVGYIVGTACAVCGVLLVALTFPVISNNFTLFYEHVRSRSLSPRVKKIGVAEAINDNNENIFPAGEQLPSYGSVSMNMHNLPHPVESTGNGTASTAMNGGSKTWTQNKDIVCQRSYVPLAKFCDASSMMDIIFQEPTEDLCTDQAVVRK